MSDSPSPRALDQSPESAPASGVAPPPRPPAASWKPRGAWMGLHLTGVVLLLYFAIQVVVTFAYGVGLAMWGEAAGEEVLAERIEGASGLLLSVGALIGNPICIFLTFILTRAPDWGATWDELRFRRVRGPELLSWLGALLLFLLGWGVLDLALKRPPVPESMRHAYATAGWLPLLWIALVVAVPLFEEILFRGFLCTALERSRLGAAGAIVGSSFLWAVIHFQYDAYNVGAIFLLGLLLGAARVRTGSILPGLAMHAAVNLMATLGVASRLSA